SRKSDAELENTSTVSKGIGKQDFALMTTEQLRTYARLFAETVTKVSNNQLDDSCG
ncbi:1608_t:CDS:2, partial [Paraglomus brasilianum]